MTRSVLVAPGGNPAVRPQLLEQPAPGMPALVEVTSTWTTTRAMRSTVPYLGGGVDPVCPSHDDSTLPDGAREREARRALIGRRND